MLLMVSTYRKNSEQTKTFSTSQKIRFHQPEWRILLKNIFLLDGKKLTGLSEKWRKKKVSTSRKIRFPYYE